MGVLEKGYLMRANRAEEDPSEERWHQNIAQRQWENKNDQTLNLMGVTTTHTLEDRQSSVTIPSRQGNYQMLFDLNELP